METYFRSNQSRSIQVPVAIYEDGIRGKLRLGFRQNVVAFKNTLQVGDAYLQVALRVDNDAEDANLWVN